MEAAGEHSHASHFLYLWPGGGRRSAQRKPPWKQLGSEFDVSSVMPHINPPSPRYVFAGGGTGGHLFPGIAVATDLRQRDPLTEVAFIGSEREIERQIIAQHGYAHHVLEIEPSTSLRRRPLRFLWKNWRATRQAAKLLKDFRPSAVIGLGGFASVPVVIAASRLGIPIVLLEQNVVPGRATRWLSRRAAAVCLSLPLREPGLPTDVITHLTGNPVRTDIAALIDERPEAHPNQTDAPVLLVLGGSQGSLAVNAVMCEVAARQPETLAGWKIIHQTGATDRDAVAGRYQQLGVDAQVEAFFGDPTDLYRRARLVVARAGATTLAEVACAGIPAILIPYPDSIGDHQLHNARWFATQGAARIVSQQGPPAGFTARLAEELAELLGAPEQRQQMRIAMRHLARPNAAAEVGQVVLTVEKRIP